MGQPIKSEKFQSLPEALIQEPKQLKQKVSSPIYRYPLIYKLAMRLLYWRTYHFRYHDLANLIPENCSVIELCAGDGELYRRFLGRKHGLKYVGYEKNQYFVAYARRKNIPLELLDISANWPQTTAEYVVMQGSLYQFFPNHKNIINKMMAKSKRFVLISEPIKNLKNSQISWVSWLARRIDRTESHEEFFGFTEVQLDQLMINSFAKYLHSTYRRPDGREKIYILDAEKWKRRRGHT